MASEVALPRELHKFMWEIMNNPRVVPEIPTLIPSYEALKGLLTSTNVKFARGIPALLDSPTPPTIEFINSLPSNFSRQNWGVYILILERPGSPTAVFVGSSTSSEGGTRKRVLKHLSARPNSGKKPSAEAVQQALDRGYTIVHCAQIAKVPLPKQQKKRIRVLIISKNNHILTLVPKILDQI
ncbi:hypothetical protein B0H65DRAFT_477286 [Neurospora tetraspora]|uniref:Uncharacterized protein n=1 Tax=Neurospora tetraspora TaxID=94610 RepID=A0AAE0J7G6_9PEZI|nr:hypothetical protein B0H65DRAFT_477286 [Neurospora tetraspora]